MSSFILRSLNVNDLIFVTDIEFSKIQKLDWTQTS